MIPRRRRRPVAVAVAVAVVSAVMAFGGPSSAGAAGDSTASSRVTRDGRIITSIINRTPIRYPGRGTAPSTYWLTLTDTELSFLLAVLANDPSLQGDFVDVMSALADAGPDRTADVQVQIRRGRFTGQTRAVPTDRSAPAQVLARRMITSLPPLRPVQSPPTATPVGIGEPAFTSFEPSTWATVVDRSLTAGAVTARVRARPVSFRVRSGDPADNRMAFCQGPGRPFDPTDPASPGRQARRAGTCAVTYLTRTGVEGRRDRWYGELTVIWRAEWTTDGITWRSLGDIPQIAVVGRTVVPATTAIESRS